ncbi:MAG TPA: GDSL-type esterase/lipase family protein [Mycobacteriales bacterium]|nr:GDSL-type esterase/lipase family protein [Mycobacteriales bacterium]
MRTRRLLLCVPVAVLAVLAGVPSPATAVTTEPIPSSMASLGDSISRGFNACGWYVDCTNASWSTGGDTAINSHYRRILQKNAAISGRNLNDARSGAKAVDLDGQAATAVSQGVEYVTVLMGANDACTSSEAAMTPVATFRAQVEAALTRIQNGLPTARVFVASIPDVKRLWFIGKDSSSARSAWSSFGICQSMLANPQSTAQADVDRRARVQQRVIDFNTQLQQVCALNPHCKYDANATFSYPFVFSQVSGWDYFHPNKSGQAALASTTYAAGFGW